MPSTPRSNGHHPASSSSSNPLSPAVAGSVELEDDETMEEEEETETSSRLPPASNEAEVDEIIEEEDEDEDDEDDSDEDEHLSPLHIEVRLSPHSTLRHDHVRHIVETFINENFTKIAVDGVEVDGWREVHILEENCESIKAAECALDLPFPPLSSLVLQTHVYQPSRITALEEFSASAEEDDDEDSEGIMAASVRELPSKGLEGVWDTLIYGDDIKNRLLNYIYTTLLFSDANVDFNVVTWNRVVLLHGPPGTGKTSLCRALAQKLAIRLSSRYPHGKLIEINSHSLFSKWFSESGKLVQRLFSTVTEMVEDESGFVVVLIDEVESLTAARAGAGSGTEPSDAMRVVNALLTQLDKLKNRKNVLIMTTSNIAQAIDSAFVDRADIKQYIGLPPQQAVYWILCGCLQELMKSDIVEQVALLDWKTAQLFSGVPGRKTDVSRRLSLRLYDLAGKCEGMSGRTLRRLPVLAHARYISINTLPEVGNKATKLASWIRAMEKVVKDENEAIKNVQDGGTTML
ncbi:P-loop containing nucleoside triphosphate hydrolase protein [Mrakia frigida]|uniref:Pch2p n=1 Tax=Mrakia frigida TaxID=29902 RepID=UPI003FCC0250